MTALARADLRRFSGTATRRVAALAPTRPTEHEQLGFELGWDHARHGAMPAWANAPEAAPLHDGFVAGRAAFGARAVEPGAPVRRWLQLRLHAWLNGRSVEEVQVTPHHLQQIEVSHCPITRVRLSYEAEPCAHAASLDRVCNDAGYAAGNLAWMSRQANQAKGALDHRAALAMARRVEAAAHDATGTGGAGGAGEGAERQAADSGTAGLSAPEWRRIATLCSFVENLSHDAACAMPLHVLPPNRLRLFNPVQALQAMLSRQFLQSGWSRRVSRFEELLPGKALQGDLKRFMMALLPRVLEAGPLADSQRTADLKRTRWAIEDAWHAPLVQQRWFAFASQLTPARSETLLQQAAVHGLATIAFGAMSEAQATDGWNLARRGRVAHAGGGAAGPADAADASFAPPRQAQLAF